MDALSAIKSHAISVWGLLAKNLRLAATAVALAGWVFSTTAYANQSWTCQYVEVGGLVWRNGMWNVAQFKLPPSFVLVQESGGLTSESVGELIASGISSLVRCSANADGLISCTGGAGALLVFNPANGLGGMSAVFGAVDDDPNQRDTLSVEAFSCQRS